jgi:hypothetical protein
VLIKKREVIKMPCLFSKPFVFLMEVKKIKFLFFFFLLCFSSRAQTTYFNKTYYFDGADSLFRTEGFGPIIEIPSSGFLGGCQSWNFNTGDTRLMIIKTDYNGDTISVKSYYDSLWFPSPSTLCYAKDSNLIMGCGLSSYLDDTTRFYLLKMNQSGDTLWTKRYSSGLKKTTHRKTALTKDGGFILCGWTGNSSNQMPTYGYAVKTDSLGNVEWQHQYGDSTKFNVATCALELNDGGYFILLWSSMQNTYDRDILLIRTDSIGNALWQQTYGVSGLLENGERIRKLKDGNYLIAGVKCLGPSVNENGKAYFIKIDSIGGIKWDKYYGSFPGQELFEIFELSDSSLVAGTFAWLTQNPSLNAGMLLKTDYYGDSLWMKTYLYDTSVTSSNDYTWSFIPTSDNGFLLAGQTNPGTTGTQDAWLIKVDSLGCSYAGCEPLEIHSVVSNLSENILIFPNPSRSFSNIRLPQSCINQICELSIIDVNCRTVYSDSFLPERGLLTYPLRTGNLPQGVYLIKVTTDRECVVRKFIKE